MKKVYVQAAAKYRMLPDDINLWYVRNKDGGMVPFSAFATSRWETGSPRLERYNGYSAVEIVGEAAPGSVPGRRWMSWSRWCISYRAVWHGMDSHVLPRTALRRAGARAVRYFAISRLPVSGGIV